MCNVYNMEYEGTKHQIILMNQLYRITCETNPLEMNSSNNPVRTLFLTYSKIYKAIKIISSHGTVMNNIVLLIYPPSWRF